MLMNLRDKKSAQFILLHKQHFDHKLIELLESLKLQNDKLRQENDYLRASCQNLKTISASLNAQIDSLKREAKADSKRINDLNRSIKQLEEEIVKLNQEISSLSDKCKQLKKEIDKRKRQNSSNTNMSSSYDILSHSRPKKVMNSRERTDRKPGGQKGHALHKSGLYPHADRIIEVKVKQAPDGAEAIRDDQGRILYHATQEIDMELKNIVTETRYYIDDEHGETLDDHLMKRYAINPLTYSDHFKAIVLYLNERGTIPLQRLSDMLSEISDGQIKLKPSTIVCWKKEFVKQSEKFRKELLGRIMERAVIHVDETGCRIDARRNWIHVISNEAGTYIVATEIRGDRETGPVGLLTEYCGVLVHDHFQPYQRLTNCQHAECNAHIERYLKSGMEFDKSEECEKMLNLLREAKKRKEELMTEGHEKMDQEEIDKIRKQYDEILQEGLKKYEEKHKGTAKKYEPQYIKLFRRMQVYQEDHLRYVTDFRVPYTNNKAERGCRVIKTKKNVSRQFKSKEGADAYASMMTVIMTARKRKENVLKTMEGILA